MSPARTGPQLREALAGLAAAGDMEPALARALAVLLASTASESGFIAALRGDGSALECFVAARADGAPGAPALAACAPWIAATRERAAPLIANDLALVDPGTERGIPLASHCGVPLVVGPVCVGVLGLANRPGGFDAGAVAALEPVFLAIACAIHARRVRIAGPGAPSDAEALPHPAEKRVPLDDPAGDVSHDLNNLFAAILGYAGLALERVGPNDPLLAEWFREIERAGLRGRELVSRRLAVAPATPAQGERERQAVVGRIAVVDDAPGVAALVHDALVGRGHPVDAFTSSEAALHAISSEPDAYDLLVTDQAMPHLTGDRLVQAVRRLRPDLPAIVATGTGDAIDERVVESWGQARLLPKPLAIDALRNAVAELLERTPAARR